MYLSLGRNITTNTSSKCRRYHFNERNRISLSLFLSLSLSLSFLAQLFIYFHKIYSFFLCVFFLCVQTFRETTSYRTNFLMSSFEKKKRSLWREEIGGSSFLRRRKKSSAHWFSHFSARFFLCTYIHRIG